MRSVVRVLTIIVSVSDSSSISVCKPDFALSFSYLLSFEFNQCA